MFVSLPALHSSFSYLSVAEATDRSEKITVEKLHALLNDQGPSAFAFQTNVHVYTLQCYAYNMWKKKTAPFTRICNC